MLPDALPHLIDMLLRLPHLEAAHLRELIQQLPDPQASAQEMLRRGWITQDQLSSLFPGPQQPTPRETMLLGFGDDESTPDGNDWSLTVSDEEDKADVPSEVEWAQPDRTDEEMLPDPETVEAVPVLSGAASTPQFEWDMVAGGNEARRLESDTDKLLRQWMGWASKGLLMWTLFLGSFFAALPFFKASSTVPSTVPPVAKKQRTLDTNQVAWAIAPAHPAEAWLADQVFEQRVGRSEKDLVHQLLAVEEVRVVSDDHVQKVRRAAQVEGEARARAAQAQAEAPARAARARVDDANARLSAIRSALSGRLGDQGLARAFQDAVRDVQQATRACLEAERACQQAKLPPKRETVGYDSDLSLHETMKRTAVQTGLVLQSGPRCQLDSSTAAQVAKLSKDLRDNGFLSAPDVMAFQAWCDQHHLEGMTGTVPTLTQLLQIEDEAKRLLLVRELTHIPSADATTQLAVRAIVDLSPAVRRAALAGLERRSGTQYLPVLLRGLRHPWPPVADHAAVALRTLHPREAVGSLVDLLDLPSPSAPVLDPRTNQYTVRELVRLNHLRNCLLCHPPSANKEDGLVRGLVPTPGEPLPVAYYEAPGSHFVRADITFLRQDFSVNLPDKDAGPWPRQQRYDFVTRLRTLSPGEVPASTESSGDYPQRGAVLYALRGLTGKDGGDSSTAWRELLGLSTGDPEGDKQRPALEEFTLSLAGPGRKSARWGQRE